MLASLIATCKMSGIDPIAYIAATLRLGKEIVRRPGKKGHCEFDVTYLAPRTKNTLAVDAVVTGKEARVLNTYIEKYRPFFATGEAAAFFPDVQGAPRSPDTLGDLISKRITTITGLKMTPHAFRHLAAKIHLDHHPGDYEGARRILNHKKIETTIAFYCAFSSRKAQADYHGLLDKYREGKQ